MGLIGTLFGNPGTVNAVATGVASVAEVFTPSATKRMELSANAQMAALGQLGAEYQIAPQGWFDRFVSALNRLPRPLLAFGTIGLFAYAMIDPPGFAQRMVGLNAVPEPLWWLLGAVVAFYFGARETHYFRNRSMPAMPDRAGPSVTTGAEKPQTANAALSDWRATQG